jgi:hypothetical protein
MNAIVFLLEVATAAAPATFCCAHGNARDSADGITFWHCPLYVAGGFPGMQQRSAGLHLTSCQSTP